MYLPQSFATAMALMILSAVFWGSWANTAKGTRNYAFALFYWDYLVGVVLCAVLMAFTLGSYGTSGDPFLTNLHAAERSAWINAFVAGAIFCVANLLLVAAIAMAGLAVAFPVAIGIAVVEGVVLSYLLDPRGDVAYLGLGVALAFVAVLLNARAYRALASTGASRGDTRRGLVVSVISGVLMGAFAPFVTAALTSDRPLTPYSVAVLFGIGALVCGLVANTWLMRRPIDGSASVTFGEYFRASPRNHALGVLGGILWGLGGGLNFIAAGFVGVPISYAIGQTAPLIAAAWGVFVWREFAGAPRRAWTSLALMAAAYLAAIVMIALAYQG